MRPESDAGEPVHRCSACTRAGRRLVALLATSFVAVLGVPLTVAFDSYLYVQSSRHVFGAGALTGTTGSGSPSIP